MSSTAALDEDAVHERLYRQLTDEHGVTRVYTNGELSDRDDVKWRPDILVKPYPSPTELAIECKGTERLRWGIGQAMSYLPHAESAGFVCYDPSPAIREVVELAPLHGWSVTRDGIEHYTTP